MVSFFVFCNIFFFYFKIFFLENDQELKICFFLLLLCSNAFGHWNFFHRIWKALQVWLWPATLSYKVWLTWPGPRQKGELQWTSLGNLTFEFAAHFDTKCLNQRTHIIWLMFSENLTKNCWFFIFANFVVEIHYSHELVDELVSSLSVCLNMEIYEMNEHQFHTLHCLIAFQLFPSGFFETRFLSSSWMWISLFGQQLS